MRAVFLDRDGVINKYPGNKKYVTSVKDFRFLPQAKKALAKLHKGGFKLFVISNQAGVAKGLLEQTALDAITRKMLAGINEASGKIEGVYYCTHHPDKNCACRKPKTGLIDLVKKKYPLNLRDSFFIGDSIRDVQTAKEAGCKSILVLCGKEKLINQKNWEMHPDFIFYNLWKAADFILRHK